MSHGHLSPSLSPFSPAGRISWGAVKISARIIRPGSILTPSVKVSVQLCVLALAVCVMLRPHASFKVSWRRSWSGCWSEWDTCTCLLWRGWHVFSVFMCLCVCVKKEWIKEGDRQKHTNLCKNTVVFFEIYCSVSWCFSAILWPHVGWHMWPGVTPTSDPGFCLNKIEIRLQKKDGTWLQFQAFCLHSSPEYSAPLTLSEVYCQPPPDVEQGYVVAVQKTEYEVGFDIHYLCKKNFLLDGPQKVTCLSNGSWSASPPYCRGEGCFKRPLKK